MMDKLQMMKCFVSVAKGVGFAPVAARANLSPVSISRSIAKLKQLLSTRLLHRITRTLSLTSAGYKCLRYCDCILEEIKTAEREAAETRRSPSGTIKIHVDFYGGSDAILAAISDYQTLYPEVKFNVSFDAKHPDLIGEGFYFLLVASTSRSDSNFVSQQLGSSYGMLCVVPSDLIKYGIPATPQDIGSHPCIALSSPLALTSEWRLLGSDSATARIALPTLFSVNTTDTLRHAVDNGMGIGLQAASSVMQGLAEKRIIRVLNNYRTAPLIYYAIYPSKRYVDAKVKTWVAFLKSYFSDTPLYLPHQA